jgi:hypothetical protein
MRGLPRLDAGRDALLASCPRRSQFPAQHQSERSRSFWASNKVAHPYQAALNFGSEK